MNERGVSDIRIGFSNINVFYAISTNDFPTFRRTNCLLLRDQGVEEESIWPNLQVRTA